MRRTRAAVLAAVLATSLPLKAQQFSELERADLPWLGLIERDDVAIVEFDQDGDSDLVVVGPDGVAVLLEQHADGSFRAIVPPWPIPIVDGLRSVHAVDLDLDGSAESVALVDDDGFLVWDFASMRQSYGAAGGRAVAPGDFDGDGDADLLVFGWSSVSMFENTGTPTWWADVSATRLPAAASSFRANQAAIGDVDADGDLDVVLTSSGVHVWINDGNGGFADETATRMRVNRATATPLALARIDADGAPEIVVGAAPYEVFHNDGAGNFVRSTILTIDEGRRTRPLPFDVDRDGDEDLLLFTVAGGLTVFENDRQLAAFVRRGAFTGAQDAFVPIGALAAAGGTGAADTLLLHRVITTSPYGYPSGASAIASGDGSGWFHRWFLATGLEGVDPFAGAPRFAIGDLDRDGWLDAFHADRFQPGTRWGRWGERRRAPTTIGYGEWTLADLDGDGDLDAATTVATGFVAVFHNDGAGGFAQPLGFAGGRGMVLAGDVDRDGDADLLVGSSLLLNDGTGTAFTVSTRPGATADGTQEALLADLDGDGWLDVVSPKDGIALHGAAPAEFRPPLPGTAGVEYLAAGDVDGDGDLDLLAQPVSATWAELWIQASPGVFAVETGARLPRGLGRGLSGAFADFDLDGDQDLLLATADGTSLFVNDGTGHFAAGAFGPDFAPPCRSSIPPGSCPAFDGLEVADFDRDGDLDVLETTAGRRGTPRLFVNRHRHLEAPLAMRAGRPFVLEISVRPGYGTGTVVAPLFAAGLLPLPFDLGPLGLLHLDPATLVPLPAIAVGPAGRAQIRFAIPTNLVGLDVHFQALVGAPDLALTALVSETIVP